MLNRFSSLQVVVLQAIFLVGLLLCLNGCASLVIESSSRNVVEQNAIGYYLPRGLIHLSIVTDGQEQYKLDIDVKSVPDEEALYTLNYLHSSFSDDKIDIKVDENGLLGSISTTNYDRTVDIAKKVIQIAKEAVKIPSAFIPAATAIRVKELLDVIIDPDDEGQIRQLKARLKENGVDFELKPLFNEKQYARISSYSRNSVYYRLKMPYIISLKSPYIDEKNRGFEKTAILFIPSRKGPTFSLDIRRAAFVENKTTLTFASGILTSSIVEKPSEVLAGLDIPLEIVRAIVALPTELIQLKINTTGKSEELVKAQTDLITSQTNYIKVLETYRETLRQAGGKASSSGSFSPGAVQENAGAQGAKDYYGIPPLPR